MAVKKRIIDETAKIVVYQNGRRIVVADKTPDEIKGKIDKGTAVALKTKGLRAFLWELCTSTPVPPASQEGA